MPTLPRISFSTKVTLALSAGLVFLLALGVFGFYSAGEFFKTGQDVRRLLQVRGNMEELSRDLERAESAVLRYQLTGDLGDQGKFEDLRLRVGKKIEEIGARLVAPDQKDRLDALKRAVGTRFELLAEEMSKRGSDGAVSELLRGERSAKTGKEVQDLVDAIGERERQITRENGERVENLFRRLLTLAVCGGAIALALLIWTISVIYRFERDRMRTESNLANARERLGLALEGSKGAAWDWDLPGNKVYLSASWPRILGGEAREISATPAELLALVHPDDVGSVQSAVQGALSGSTLAYSEEHRVRNINGDWIWILSRGKVVRRDNNGRALRIAGTNQDVSERKASELALQEHDRQLELALAAAGMVRWDWNVTAYEFVWPEDPVRLVGPAPNSGYLSLQDMVHPEDLVHFIRTLDGAVQHGESYKDQYRITRTDGTIAWVSARGYVVRDVDGKVQRVVGVAQDVSEIKHTEQALRASERELRLITDSVPAFIGYTDTNETILFCNKALAIFVGTQQNDLIGRPLRELYGEDVYRILQPHVKRVLAGENVRFERRHTRSNHGPVDLDVTYIPRRDALGEVEGFYFLVTDITELKRLDRMKSEFVSTVSHELRTPLTSIRGSLGILAGGVAGPLSDKVRSFIEIAKDNCERLIRLINDILDMEKIESGKMTFEFRVLDLMELVERTVSANEGFAAQHGVRLQVVTTAIATKIRADGDRLAQVLTNLISNACKFSPAESSVDIAVRELGERIRVEVIDHGPGISEAFRKRIFQKFSQEDSSDMRQKGGTGLGLSISKAIVEGLGGEIGFETETGKGSTFYFYLPQWREPVVPPAAMPLTRARVLVCEDDLDMGKRLQVVAEKAGYESDIARTATEVRLLLRERHYVAITLDLDLAHHDALSLMRDMRANPATARLPVILLGADRGVGQMKAGGAYLGVVDWLGKPIDEMRLLADLQLVQRAAGSRPRVLHVEDDADVRNVVATIARGVADFEAAATFAEASAKLKSGRFDLVLLDLGLPDGSGWDLLPLINGLVPPIHVVIFSARDADHDSGILPYAFLVKSQTTDQHLIEVIQEAVKTMA